MPTDRRRFLALAALTPPLAVAAPPDALSGLYFPTAVGARWVYRHPVLGDEHVHLAAVATAGGVARATVRRRQLDGLGEFEEVMAASAAGLERVRRSAGGADLVVGRLLALPAVARAQWVVAGDGWTEVRTAGSAAEPVAVPAGRLTALRVEVARVTGDGTVRRTAEWYAPGVGLVREVWRAVDGAEAATVELASFRPGGAKR